MIKVPGSALLLNPQHIVGVELKRRLFNKWKVIVYLNSTRYQLTTHFRSREDADRWVGTVSKGVRRYNTIQLGPK